MISFQDSLSLPVLQFVPAGERAWRRLLSLYDMQLLPGNKIVGPQVQGEKSRNKLPYML